MSVVVARKEALHNECARYLIGQENLVDLMLVGAITGGHILLEGVPGIAKTLACKVFAKAVHADFSRIQFTPDLLPSDVLGTSIFNRASSQFEFRKGPIFSNIVLIDEINRAPAKSQAALFEVMEEKQISFDGNRYEMDFPFMVLATQNPIEQEGTYRLPEGQLDRFLFKIVLKYPSAEDEVRILERYLHETERNDLSAIEPVIGRAELQEMRTLLAKVFVEKALVNYISQIVRLTREDGQLYLGSSPRGGLAILHASKAVAMLDGRDYLVPDDIQFVVGHTLNHRLILSPMAEMDGLTTSDVVRRIVEQVEVPR